MKRRDLLQAMIAAPLAACTTATTRLGPGSTWERVKTRRQLVVATNCGWQPQSFLADDGTLTGFDVDVAREIAHRLSVRIRFATPDWALMTGGHWRGRFDMMVGSATPTKARAKVVDFAGIYYYSPYVFVVNAASAARRRTDLNGKIIGVETGTTSEDYIRGHLAIDDPKAPPVTYDVKAGRVRTYASSMLPFDDLRLPPGVRLDAVLAAEQTALQAIHSGYPIRILNDGYAFREPLTVITDKDDPMWTAQIRDLIGGMRRDGALRAITQHWYGRDYSS